MNRWLGRKGSVRYNITVGLLRIPVALAVILLLGWTLGSVLAGPDPGVGPTRSSPEIVASAPSTEPTLPSQVPEPVQARSNTTIEYAQVLRVVDGDTFEARLDGKQVKVRVLGIDSCEMSTPGGLRAKEAAETLLSATNNTVTLTREPTAPDKDQYGRLLRYMAIGAGDFGGLMVIYDHTGVYGGHNDASPTYLAELRGYDLDGRNCAAYPAPTPEPEEHYVPVPNNGGDDNDHRRRNRFCGHHWWC